jgi:DNA-binding NarL/FixJ family response regulator
MPRKKKVFKQTASLPYARVGPSDTLADSLRALINGLFGKKKAYHPTQQQIADYYLTPREREIAYLAALGFSYQEIADALGLTFQTVRVHLRNILDKMQLEEPRELRDYFTHDLDPDSNGH